MTKKGKRHDGLEYVKKFNQKGEENSAVTIATGKRDRRLRPFVKKGKGKGIRKKEIYRTKRPIWSGAQEEEKSEAERSCKKGGRKS